MNRDDYIQFRIEHDLKTRAKLVAEDREESLSEVLRTLLRHYVHDAEEDRASRSRGVQ